MRLDQLCASLINLNSVLLLHIDVETRLRSPPRGSASASIPQQFRINRSRHGHLKGAPITFAKILRHMRYHDPMAFSILVALLSLGLWKFDSTSVTACE